jgi:hypothetical protein
LETALCLLFKRKMRARHKFSTSTIGTNVLKTQQGALN